MANQKITDLAAATTPLTFAEIMQLVQAGANVQVSISELFNNINTIQLDTSPTPGAHAEGKLYWDSDAGTLAVMTDVTDVVLQVGQETYVKAKNNSGGQIDNGEAVYISGATGNRPRVELAQADVIATLDVLGLATEDIANGSDGYITVRGLVRDVNTGGYNAGDILYLSESVAGGLQDTVPITGYSAKVGVVIYAHASDGIILVRPEIHGIIGDVPNGNYLEVLSDGSLLLHGDATAHKDELQSLVGSASLTSPAADFVRNAAEAAITAKISARYPTDYLAVSIQLNHDWAAGTNLDPHLHWEQTTANIPNWLIEYRWQKTGQTKTTVWTPVEWQSNVYTYTAGTLNQITEFGPITPPVGYGDVSDVVQVKIYRDYTNVSGLFAGGDPVAASQDLTNFDIHKEVDKLGSRTEYA